MCFVCGWVWAFGWLGFWIACVGGFGWLNSFGLGLGFLVLGFDMRFALWVWLDLWSFLLFLLWV